MFFFVFLSIIIIRSSVNSTIFYIDCENGNDNNLGTSISSPFQSIEKINSYLTSSLTGGDEIRFKNNCIYKIGLFDESLKIDNVKGTENEKIIIGGYGDDDEKPIITGGYEVENDWNVYLDKIYHVVLPGRLTKLRQVFVDEKVYNISHYPRDVNDYIYMDGGSKNTIVVKSGFPLSNADVTGAHAFSRNARWILESSEITGLVGNTLNLATDYDYTPSVDKGFYLTNKLNFLEKGDWYFDPPNLYIWMEDDSDPNLKTVVVSEKSACVEILNSEHIIFEGFHIKHCVDGGIHFNAIQNVVIQNNLIEGIGMNGINANGGGNYANVVIRNNEIKDIAHRGISIVDWGYNLNNFEISGNVIENIFVNPFSYFHDSTFESWSGGSGIVFVGNQFNIKLNDIRKIGYNGIFYMGAKHLIEQNFLKGFCMLLDDCGGIYGYDGIDGTITNNIIIRSNTVIDSIGNPYGTNNLDYSAAQGIYLDDKVSDIEILFNTVINADLGFQMHNCKNTLTKGNIVYNTRSDAYYITEDNSQSIGFTRNNVVKENIFHSKKGCVKIGYLDGWSDLASFSTNYYYSKDKNWFVLDGTVHSSLEDWKLTGNDIDSVIIGDQWFESIPFVYTLKNNQSLIQNGDFTENKNHWSGGHSTVGTITTQWSDKFGGSLESFVDVPKDPNDDIFTMSSSFPILEDEDYVLTFSSCSNPEKDHVAVCVRQDGTSGGYLPTGLWEYYTIYPRMEEYSFAFKGRVDEPFSRIDFYSGSVIGVTYYLDTVSLYHVDVTLHDTDDDYTIMYNENPTTIKVVFDEYEKYCDVNGRVIKKSITLEPGRGIFLVNCFCNKDRTCNNKENSLTCPEECEPICGNKVCENGENIQNCPKDCLFTPVFTVIFSVVIVLVTIVVLIILIVILILCFSRAKKRGRRQKAIDITSSEELLSQTPSKVESNDLLV